MSASNENLKDRIGQAYKDGFVTDIESDSFESGLNEDVTVSYTHLTLPTSDLV